MKIRELREGPLSIAEWDCNPGEYWCVLGGNGSGKSWLGRCLSEAGSGQHTAISEAPKKVALLSFESAQSEYERELEEEDTDFLDRIDYGSTGRELLLESGCSEDELLQGFDWQLQPKEHTLITGPNGCGKSTLLSLITGDHPQCYVNRLQLFGYRRGSGESIWDIKRHIGYLSPTLHRDYRVSCTVETAVVSGFYDSVGLYQTPSSSERQTARQWLELFELGGQANASFRSLSYGQQRLALVARALVKQPPLLILDEPTQGLDDLNRQLVLACLERLADLQRTTLLFVSHRADEHLPVFKKRLVFEADPSGQARFRILKQG